MALRLLIISSVALTLNNVLRNTIDFLVTNRVFSDRKLQATLHYFKTFRTL